MIFKIMFILLAIIMFSGEAIFLIKKLKESKYPRQTTHIYKTDDKANLYAYLVLVFLGITVLFV